VLLSLCKKGYLARLTELRAALKQRNAALKMAKRQEAQAFDRHVAEAAAYVSSARYEWAKAACPQFIELSTALGEKVEPFLEYSSRHWTPDGGADGIAEALRARIERDLRKGMTTVGPHRDDLVLKLGDNETRRFGSAGQQRTAATALRLLEANALADSHNTAPIALFDDAFAELDQDRQERLLTLIEEALPGQAIITAPRDAEVPKALFERPRWYMSGGRLEQ
jgi:DNA replication and repair protein RecF